ncbi:MAG TPA: type II secretion system protein [Tepidisphaeraceae bacterium]|jgi:prepilin-type N-terminal cleavage/methylation domain-containing protein/prepilin-type processing-associated H-X9-DG protein
MRTRKTGGFTLVELLVVIGIIALLIAILLPTLQKARRASENAACLSNLRQIGQASISYRAEFGRIPFFFVLRNYPWQPVAPTANGNTVWWTSFGYGGKTTHENIQVGYVEDASKPLNKYLWKDQVPEPWLGAKTAADRRMERNVFRCPADGPDGIGNYGVGVPLDYLGPGVRSCYELYGTSYMSNRGFMYDPAIVKLAQQMLTSPLTHEKVNSFNNGVSKIVMRWNATETYVAADVLFLWSLFYHQALPGAHSKQNVHNAVFLDGHAAPAYVTARNLEEWGTRIPGRYTPKAGDGWREARGYDPQLPTPWGGGDPFGSGPRETGQGPGK